MGLGRKAGKRQRGRRSARGGRWSRSGHSNSCGSMPDRHSRALGRADCELGQEQRKANASWDSPNLPTLQPQRPQK